MSFKAWKEKEARRVKALLGTDDVDPVTIDTHLVLTVLSDQSVTKDDMHAVMRFRRDASLTILKAASVIMADIPDDMFKVWVADLVKGREKARKQITRVPDEDVEPYRKSDK